LRLLLDTHILLWWMADDPALPQAARQAIADPDNEVLVSAAAVWEIAIKQASGKLEAPLDLLPAVAENDFGLLAITAVHALAAGALPPLHADPFDRMLVAQAQAEGLTLVTVDSRLADYGGDVLGDERPPRS
jgi:PIN domain nuclease of toxin-antitoxin system